MLEKIKLALRYSNSIFDEELQTYIEAFRKDLIRVGVSENKIDNIDPTIVHCCICYCKWQLNFQNKGEEWGNLYRELRQDIALDGDYKWQVQ